jgi:lipopolysaccharide assembly outer membrane protein LptD (OstA)
MPGKGMLGALNLDLGIGLTHNLYYDGDNYTPYNYDGTTDWNSSNLFSSKVPFRYRLKTDSSIRGKYGSFSWNVPFYSDPLMDSDFMHRAEEMDWINMLQKGSALEEEEITQSLLGSYVWSFSGQVNPTFPNMSPYINSISISSISLSVSFRQYDTMPSTSELLPSRYFFAPETATLYSVSGSISGTPLSLGGGTTTTASQAAVNKDTTDRPDPLVNIGVPRSPFEDKEKQETQQKDQSDKLVPPEITQRFDLPRTGSVKFSVDYRLAPSSSSTLRFDYNKWKSYEDIDWNDVSTILTNFGGDGSVTFNVNHTENLFFIIFSYTGNRTWR